MLVIALFLVFVVMASQFESLRDPVHHYVHDALWPYRCALDFIF